MRLLVLGGTQFLGRHLVGAALEAGDSVTLFNRGRTHPGLFAGRVERIEADRDGGLDALAGGEWDVVVDTSGYVPRVVGASAVVEREAEALERTLGLLADEHRAVARLKSAVVCHRLALRRALPGA